MDESYCISSTEIIKEKLYFTTLLQGYKPKSTKNCKYFQIDNEIVYESFYNDFGPYHLCHLSQFCRKLNIELADAPKNKKVVFYTYNVDTLRLNAAYLIGSYAIIYLGKSPQWIYNRLTENCNWKLLRFRDASDGPMLFDINLLDVLQGLHIAHQGGFFNLEDFDEFEYLYYEKVENGDLNWIIPQKMLAFSGPHARSRIDRGYQLHSPEHYHRYFKDNGVTTIVRLNKEKYDARQFTSYGFEHRDLFFVDGSAPTDGIVNRFIKICESAPGAVAVHCKAGLGRTGTLIGCYMMRNHGFTARQAIAWLRICRPGSVIGLQQAFMENIQARMFAEGEMYRKKHNITSFPKFKRGIYSEMPPESLSTEAENIENKANDNIPVKEKPVSLNTILNNVGNTSVNNNRMRVAKKTKKLDNTNAMFNTGNNLDPENNKVTSKRPAYPVLVTTETGYIPKMNFMMPTNNMRNANNTNLKNSTRPKAARPAILTSTFPPRSSSLSLSKLQSAKIPNKPLQRTTASLKTYSRKTSNMSYSRVTNIQHNTTVLSPNNNTASTITALTENCSIDARNGNISDINISVTSRTNNHDKSNFSGKKTVGLTVFNSRKKQSRNVDNAGGDLNSNVDLSGSDTTVANLSVDSLEVTSTSKVNEKIRRKRDMSKSPEPLTGEDVSSDNFEETTNSQGNRLYKIKAMREKYPAVRATVFSKRDSSKTRIGTVMTGSAAKKK